MASRIMIGESSPTAAWMSAAAAATTKPSNHIDMVTRAERFGREGGAGRDKDMYYVLRGVASRVGETQSSYPLNMI